MAFFTNQAQLRYGNEVANSNITVGEIQEVLSVTKSAVKQTYRQHDTVTYIINIVNAMIFCRVCRFTKIMPYL